MSEVPVDSSLIEEKTGSEQPTASNVQPELAQEEGVEVVDGPELDEEGNPTPRTAEVEE